MGFSTAREPMIDEHGEVRELIAADIGSFKSSDATLATESNAG